MEGLDKYIFLMERRLFQEPEWMPPSVAKSFVEVLMKEETGIFNITPDTQNTLNKYVFAKAKAYSPGLCQIIMEGSDDYLFSESKLFPIHTFEWILGCVELFVEHCKETEWIAKRAFSRIARVSEKRYGREIAATLMKTAESLIRQKNCDWNRALYETFDCALSFIESYSKSELEEAEYFINDTICVASKHMWGSKDNMEILEYYKLYKDYEWKTRVGLVMLHTISQINVKTKRKSRNCKIASTKF